MRIKFTNKKVADAPANYVLKREVSPNEDYHETGLVEPANMSQLKDLIKKAIANRFPVLVLGPSGYSKTALAHEIAASFGMTVIDIRLQRLEVEDIKGLPSKDTYTTPMGERTTASYSDVEFIKPIILEPAKKWLLVFDEITHADMPMMRVMQQIIGERTVGTYKLPDTVGIFVAGNAKSEDECLNALPDALIRRFGNHAYWIYNTAVKDPNYYNDYLEKTYKKQFEGHETLFNELLHGDWSIAKPSVFEDVLKSIVAAFATNDAHLPVDLMPSIPSGEYAKLDRIYQDENVAFKTQNASSKRKQQVIDIKKFIETKFTTKAWTIPSSTLSGKTIPVTELLAKAGSGAFNKGKIKLTEQQANEVFAAFPDLNDEMKQMVTESSW